MVGLLLTPTIDLPYTYHNLIFYWWAFANVRGRLVGVKRELRENRDVDSIFYLDKACLSKLKSTAFHHQNRRFA